MFREQSYNDNRKIIHVDMDAFFAAVEMRDFPEYRNKPLIVGGPPNSRGVVSTCSYEARKYGIHSAMPSAQAYKLCPHAIFVKGRFEAYKEASLKIREIFMSYSNLVEPLSLDEAYIDVTNNKFNIKSATIIAKEIKDKIYTKTKLTASAGVSYNKFLAKIGSDLDKPDGLVVITPENALNIIDKLSIDKFYGIGKVTAQKMKKLGIYNGSDLRKYDLRQMLKIFGKTGFYYYNISRGIDRRPVVSHRDCKSIGNERTFREDIDDAKEMLEFYNELSEKVSKRMKNKNVKGKTVTIKIKYADFEQITRSKTLVKEINEGKIIFHIARQLLLQSLDNSKKVRLLGVSLSNLQHEKNKKWEQMIFPFYDE